MKALIIEDDFTCRKLLSKILSEFAECDTAVNGLEGIEAFNYAHAEGAPYDLICLDIMMPEMDGQTTLKNLRKLEEEKNIHCSDTVKIIMTTALDDIDNIKTAFREQCEGYLVKPIEKEKLVNKLNELGLIK